MALFDELHLDNLSPSKLWQGLDPETRQLAARAMYAGTKDQGMGRREADLAIAAALRFREVAVRKMPVEKRIGHLSSRLYPDDALASSLLLALHMEFRVNTLSHFLDHLGVPHEEGAIDDEFELPSYDADALRPAVEASYERCPQEEVDVYLASLLALDDETWGGLEELLRQRASS